MKESKMLLSLYELPCFVVDILKVFHPGCDIVAREFINTFTNVRVPTTQVKHAGLVDTFRV